jgi:hypothetical protein
MQKPQAIPPVACAGHHSKPASQCQYHPYQFLLIYGIIRHIGRGIMILYSSESNIVARIVFQLLVVALAFFILWTFLSPLFTRTFTEDIPAKVVQITYAKTATMSFQQDGQSRKYEFDVSGYPFTKIGDEFILRIERPGYVESTLQVAIGEKPRENIIIIKHNISPFTKVWRQLTSEQ